MKLFTATFLFNGSHDRKLHFIYDYEANSWSVYVMYLHGDLK